MLTTLMIPSFVLALAAWSMHLPVVRSVKLLVPPAGLGGIASLVQPAAATPDAPQEFDALNRTNVSLRVTFPALASTRALYWLHITKCGTSFANVILHTPSTCPALPTDFVWHAGSRRPGADEALKGYCPELIFSAKGHFGSHDALGSVSGKALGNAVTMLRNAEQRILSSFHDNYHDWLSRTPPTTELQFARKNVGCQVRMLVRSDAARGDFSGACMYNLPSKEEVVLARTTLRRDFSFVGLIEEYRLSVCLFRVMFGGPCLPIMFSNVHKAGAKSVLHENTSVTMYDTDVLQGFVDRADRALYDEGVQIFYELLVQYNVSQDICEACYHSPSE